MALSDSCFDFLHTVAAAATQLAEEAHYYSAPDHPLNYGPEVDALRRQAVAFGTAPYDPEAGAMLLRLATSIMHFHDSPPDSKDSAARRTDMRRLVELLQAELDVDDAKAAPAVVQNVVRETVFTEPAATRLKAMLSRLGKPAYDVAVKVISDIGSATAKKILGL